MKYSVSVVLLVTCIAVLPESTLACELHTTDRNTEAQLVVDWNEQVLRIAEEEDGFLTLKGLRTAAMMHIAMHDALSSIDGTYTPYVYESDHRGADPVSAAAVAAFTVAADQYSNQLAVFEALQDRYLAGVEDVDAMRRGQAAGKAAARAILEARKDDGWNSEAEYQWHPMGPGVYAEFNEHSGTPEGFVFGAGWGVAKPFVMESNDQFLAPPPPDIDSPAYTRAFNEVKEVGRFQTMERTLDQTHLALWWKDFAENSHNRLARTLIIKESLSLLEAARLLALVNMSIFDAYVSSFYNKFYYNHWRPYTAIRWAENDGNPDTEPEANWTNTHRHTYAFPSYPSAHGTACAAAMTAMADTFGDDYSFTMVNSNVDIAGPFSGKMEMHPPTRSFDRFSDAAMECALSRIYLGIHFRYDSVEGVELGHKVGRQAVGHYLERR